jgi:TolB-like protein/DNA-binding winged helix-turn-helix (wHTH) protein/lipopolysaccharide biosynthesis regulator YciM
MSNKVNEIYEFGDFRLDVQERKIELRGNGESAGSLPEKAFQTLVYLVRNGGRLVTKDELIEAVWPGTFVEENNLDKAVYSIRQLLGEKPGERKYVETVRKHGYRFVAEVIAVQPAELAPPPEDEITQAEERESEETERNAEAGETPPKSFPWRWAVIGGVIVLAAGLIVLLDPGGAVRRLADVPRVGSMAVLPLENLSGDATQEYFADGMTEALITELAKTSGLRVISRQSVQRYRSDHRPLPEIARELGVDAVLTGSVARAGDKVRITVQLVHAATERNLWAESYERDLRDVLALQKRAAEDIVGRIRVKLTEEDRARTDGTAGPVNPEAYDHYLRGKYYLHRQTREDNEAAISALEKSVGADPAFAAAHAELAQAYVWKLFLFQPDDRALAERAYMAAEKALALDPNLAVAYLARGRLLWTPANRFPHEKAIREYRRALELDPNLDEARNQLALVYNHVGAFEEALAELQLAVETNPSNSLAQFRIGETYLFQERYEEALAALRDVPSEVNPSLVGHQIVWALFNLGRREEAAAALERFMADFPNDNRGLFTSQQAVLAAAAGDKRSAEEKIRAAIEKGRGFGHFHHTGYHIACAYALMNEREAAVEWLEKISEEGFPCYPLFEKDKNLDNLRQDPQYAVFMSRLRQQWERYRASL